MPLTVSGQRQFGQLNDNEFSWYGMRGLNINDAPEQLDDGDLTQAINVYLRFDGGVEQRRGITTHGSQLSASPGSNCFRFWQQVINGAASSAAYTLAQVGGNLYNGETGAQIGANNVLGVGALPACFAKIFDPNHTGGASDICVMTTGVGGPYAFDGSTVYTLPGAAAVTAGARWCAVVNNVLWLGGLPLQPNLIVGTLVGNPESEPFYQQIALSQPVMGLAVIGSGAQAQLVAGHRHGLSILSGVNPSNFILQEVPYDDGVVAGRSMLTDQGLLYFLGNRAVYTFDGAVITPISKNVQPWILNDPLYPDFPMNGDRTISWAFLWNNRYVLFYDSGGVGYPNTALVFDLVVQGWTVLTGLKLYGFCMKDAPGDATPYAALVMDATKGQLYNWDAFVNTTAYNVSDNGAAIAAVVSSKYFKLGQPGTPKKLRRFYFELFLLGANPNLSINAGTISDYGTVVTTGIVSNTGIAGAEWDVSQWDQASFATGTLQYFQYRKDFNVVGEAFAFTINSNVVQPPWRWMGGSGVFVQGARR